MEGGSPPPPILQPGYQTPPESANGDTLPPPSPPQLLSQPEEGEIGGSTADIGETLIEETVVPEGNIVEQSHEGEDPGIHLTAQ